VQPAPHVASTQEGYPRHRDEQLAGAVSKVQLNLHTYVHCFFLLEVRRENRGSNLGVKLALLILTTQPLEQVHQVLIPEVIVEVGRHMPHAPPVSDIWPYQRMTVGRFLKLSDCGQQASMSVRTLLHLGAASIIFLRNLLDWFYKLQFGGVAADFRPQQISDRVFKIVVFSRNVGFHIYNLKAYSCDQYKVFFHRWGGGGAKWRSVIHPGGS
jgi:hypothetical protein